MPNAVDVTFSDPDGGEIVLTVYYKGESAAFGTSSDYNSFLELTLALHRLLFTQGESVVSWRIDELEVETRFLRIGDVLALEIDQFTHQYRHSDKGQRLLFASGSYAEICLPFHEALVSLRDRFTVVEFGRRWNGRFPTQELVRLTDDVRRVHSQS